MPMAYHQAIEVKFRAWRDRYMREEPGLACIYNGQSCRYVHYNGTGEFGPAVTTSEAHGYGMLISVLYGSREDFDSLIRYADYFRNKRGLLGWQQQRDTATGRLVPGTEGGENSATDGDLDCVAALWIAAQRWPDGRVYYIRRAQDWGNAILEHCVHPERAVLLVGDWAHPRVLGTSAECRNPDKRHTDNDGISRWFRFPVACLLFRKRRSGTTQVQTTPRADQITRPSDYCLGHLALFAEHHQAQQATWIRVLNASRECMQQQARLSPNTGLVADFLVWHQQQRAYLPADGCVLETTNDGIFSWNACRVPWRLAHYYLLTRDPVVGAHLRALVRFFEQRCQDGLVYAGYRLDGHATVDYTDLAFLAPAAFCLWVMASPHLESVLQQMDRAYGEASYFGETIALLTMLQTQDKPFIRSLAS